MAEGLDISWPGCLLGLQGCSLLLPNLNGDSCGRATSQEQADAKIAEARGPSGILQDFGS
jgi:hypothetical protein